jgi:hypothetical protein
VVRGVCGGGHLTIVRESWPRNPGKLLVADRPSRPAAFAPHHPQCGISQTTGPAVFLDGNGAASAKVLKAFFDGGFGFRADIVEVRQVIEHIRQAVIRQSVDELVNILTDVHDGPAFDDTFFTGFVPVTSDRRFCGTRD